jgi:N-acetylneuraminic acid mutarotase
MISRRDLLLRASALTVSSLLGSDAMAISERSMRWRRCASVPWPVQEVYATVYKDRALIAGGMVRNHRGGSIAINRVGVYDPILDRWSEGKSLPQARHHAALASVNASIYAIGGATHQPGLVGHWRQRTEVFVLHEDVWRTSTPLPQAQSEGVALVLENNIHLITGRTSNDSNASRWEDQHDVDTHRILDTSTDKWTLGRPAPGVRNSATGAIIDDVIYLVGGRTTNGGNLDRLDRYDPEEDRWDTLRPMPHAAGGLAGASVDGMLIVFGGEELNVAGPQGVIDKAWQYDPKHDVWTALEPMLTPRHGLGSVAIGASVYTIGGGAHTATGLTSDIVEALTVHDGAIKIA